MLIVNADDLGRSPAATDAILRCFADGRITSTSAMMFMADSERAAELAKNSGIDVGLHINFTESFTAPAVSDVVRKPHERIRLFLGRSKYAQLFYNPFCSGPMRDVFGAQVQEFQRLYGFAPYHLDGHQHAHLCTNVLLDKILPVGTKVRRSFSFRAGEKGMINRSYRRVVDGFLARRHTLTDYFFALSQNLPISKLRNIFELANRRNVELMAHPEQPAEYDRLMSPEYAGLLKNAILGDYASL